VAPTVDLRVSPDAPAAARAAATFIARVARNAVARRGTFHLAVSGGSTPALLFRSLVRRDIDWSCVHVWQVDERVAPDDDDARNATPLRRELLDRVPLPSANIHLMDVTARDLDDAARRYAATLVPLDLVHLGLGDDGHTASWPPDQPDLLDAPGRVAITAPFRGFRRMTLTPRAVRDARRVIWLVCGADKRDPLARALTGDTALPAQRALDARSVLFVDRASWPGGGPQPRSGMRRSSVAASVPPSHSITLPVT